MGKLHELLAVEKSLEAAATRSMKEAQETFGGRRELFFGLVKRYVPFEEEASERESIEEHKELDSTVNQHLDEVSGHVGEWLDAVLQKECSNQVAQADLVLEDGTVLAEDVPATFLLGLETKLRSIRNVIRAIPTLPPGTKWEKDPNRGAHIYAQSHPEERFRTKKTIAHKVLVPATEKHPAQIEKWTEDQNIGKYITEKWCGLLSPGEKADLERRLDQLERAVKKARQRANSVEVVRAHIGKDLLAFLLRGETSE